MREYALAKGAARLFWDRWHRATVFDDEQEEKESGITDDKQEEQGRCQCSECGGLGKSQQRENDEKLGTQRDRDGA